MITCEYEKCRFNENGKCISKNIILERNPDGIDSINEEGNLINLTCVSSINKE